MAKKSVPLRKPKGSDGEGNIKVPGGPVVLDLGEFDDIFGPMDSESPKQGPLGQFYTGLKDSLGGRFKTKDIVRNFLRSAAPDGLSNVMGFADEAMAAGRDIKDSLERTNAADLQYIAKRAQKMMPQVKDYMSEDTYNNISQGLENKIDEYDYTVQSQRDQTAIRRARQDEADNNQIKAAMDNIALTDRLNHNKSEQAANARHNQTRAENSIRDVLTTKRFDFMAKSMGMAVDTLQRISGYNEQVDYGFQRKGLELQFRSYLGIKELIKLSEAHLELNARAYNALVRNTALADHQKSNRKDLMNIGQEKDNRGFMSKAVQAVGGKTLSQFYGNYSGETQSRVKNSLSQKLSMAVSAMKMGEGGPSLWDNKYSMAGQLAGDYLSDFLINDLVPMIGREARGPLTRLSDKHGGRHNQAGYYMDNMPAFLQEFVNNNQNQHGWKGSIRDLIAPYVPQFGLQDRLQNGTFQTIDQQAVFNQATQRSIVDAIPGYLARILQELRMVRTGRDDVGREVFDMTNGKFGLEKAAHENMQNRIIPENAVKVASSTINDALNQIDKDGKLSPQARKALGERLLRDSSSNNRFDPEAYIKSRGYAQGTSPEVAAELESHFRSQFQFDEDGKMSDTSDNHKLRQEFSQAFLDIRSISRDPVKEINRLINSGHTEPLRAMGIIITEKGQDRINYPRIWEILRSGVSDHNPYAPGGSGDDPDREDNSGKKGHKDFVGPTHPGMAAAFAQGKVRAFRQKYAPEEQAARDAMAKHLKTMRGRFGSAAKGVQESFADITGGKGTDYTPGIQSFSQMMSGAGGYAPQNMSGGYKAFVGDAVAKHQDKLKGYGVDGMQQLTDLYSSFDPTQPIIKGIDFGMGDLIDVNTKKIVTKPSDITGEVINRLGQTVVTVAEAAAGLLTPKGEIAVKATEAMQGIVDKALGRNRSTNQSNSESAEPSDPNNPDELNKQDWSLGPGENAIITARGLMNGEYRDAAGKIIDSIADISSDIYDKTGNLVLSAKEFANGLWSKRSGKRYRPTKGFARILKLIKGGAKFSGSTATSLGFGALKFTAKAALGVASAAFNFVMDNQNAYLPGEAVPVITRRQLQAGEYYDDKGKVIEDFVDVYSPMYNVQGEMVIAPELYKQLKNFDGSRHILAKNRRIWAKYILRPMRAVRDAYMRGAKKYYKWLGKTSVKVGGWAGRKVFGGFAKMGGKLFDSMFESVEDPNAKAQIDATLMASQQQTSAIQEVVNAINGLKPKENRKGSWQDQASKKAGINPNARKEADAADEKQQGFFKRGLAGLASMLGFGKKGNDAESEEDEGFGLDDVKDIADIGDSIRGDRGDGERGGRRRRRRPGRLSRWGKAIADSKIGKWVANSTVARTAVQFGGRAIAMAATGVSSILSAPVLGAAAVIGGTYLGAKRWSEIHGDFRELRFEQYGVGSPVKQGLVDSVMNLSMFSLGGDKKKVMALEDLLLKSTDRNSATPTMNVKAAGAQEILDAMGISSNDPPAVMAFSRWLEKRFKPIYLAWVAGLQKIGKSDITINEVDDKLPNELKGDFLNTIKFPYSGDTPYAVLDNPFNPDYPLVDNISKIEKMFDEMTKKYADDKAKPKETGDVAKTATTATTAAVAANTALNTANKVEAENKASKDIASVPLGAKAIAATSMSGVVANLTTKIGNTVTALQSIRMRAYGLQTLHMASVRSLLSLEAVYAKDLTVTEGVVDYNGDDGKLLVAAGELLGKDTSVGSSDRPKLYKWLMERFGPTFRAYYGTAKALNPSADLKTLDGKLSGADKVSVGQAIIGANFRHDQTVWEGDSIFDVKGPLIDLKKLAEVELQHLQKESEKEVIDSPTQKGSDQMAGKNTAESGGSFSDKIVNTIKDTWSSTKETISSAWDRASEATKDTYAGAKIAVGMGPDYGEGGAKGGAIKSTGNGGEMLQGTGGKFEELPYPSANGSIKAAYPTLLAAGKMTGVPVDWLTVIAGIESGFNYTVKASTSTATGWYQFINATWDEVVKLYGAKYGIPGIGADPERKARKDPRASALMGGEFIKSNYDRVSKGIGRKDLTDTDIYMAHFLGPGGAIKFLKADPNAMAYKIFSKEYSANMSIFFVNSKPSQPRTISDVYKLFQAKMDKFWNTVGKGYRQGESTQSDNPNADAQTPGAVETSAAADSANLKEKLKDDTSLVDDKTESSTETSNIEQGSGTGSVQNIARNTTPMPGAPSGGGGSGSNSSTNSTATDSASGTSDSQQQSQMDAAQSQNTRRAAEVKRNQEVASEVNDIQTKQLNTLFEIRDLMKLQLDNSKEMLKSLPSVGASGGQGSGNNMNPSTMQGRPAAQRQSSVTLR